MSSLLEFYWIPAEGSLEYCESITLDATSADLAIARANDMLAHHTFPLGHANLCLIKNAEGRLLHEVWALPLPPANTDGE